MTGGVYSRLWGAYERLLEATARTASDADAGSVRRPSSLVSRFRTEQGKIIFECCVVLENWKWRASKTVEHVTIVIHAKESLINGGQTLEKSVVKVSYFEPQNDAARWLHTVHFDFEPQLRCHPTFHAQLTREIVVPSAEDRRELNCRVNFEAHPGRCFERARIPTSDMTLASVLLCVVADHIREELFAPFKARVLEIQREMPMPNYDPSMKASLRNDVDRLGSSHWFAHVP
jgi:hypothetical protein